MNTNALALPPLMTREKVREYLNAHGYPVSKSYFDKICSPQINAGPIPERYWNKRPLYDPAKALAWAEAKSLSFKAVTDNSARNNPVLTSPRKVAFQSAGIKFGP